LDSDPEVVRDAQAGDPNDAPYKEWLLGCFEKDAPRWKQVVLVRITESLFTVRPLPQKHLLETKGSVVRSYKGGWKVGEKIACSQEWESVPKDWRPPDGKLVVLFLDEHNLRGVGLDVGQVWHYDQDLESVLRRVFSSIARK
jgi:hypothetical protein